MYAEGHTEGSAIASFRPALRSHRPNEIYEEDFLGFSYGFRPGRSQHQALDALSVGLVRKKVNYVLDADIRGFFDNIDHEWLMRFIQHRVADRRILRLIQKWLKAGVLEEGNRSETRVGTPQGAVITPRTQKITSVLSAYWGTGRCAQRGTYVVSHTVV